MNIRTDRTTLQTTRTFRPWPIVEILLDRAVAASRPHRTKNALINRCILDQLLTDDEFQALWRERKLTWKSFKGIEEVRPDLYAAIEQMANSSKGTAVAKIVKQVGAKKTQHSS